LGPLSILSDRDRRLFPDVQRLEREGDDSPSSQAVI
jgi:hypothetical protein